MRNWMNGRLQSTLRKTVTPFLLLTLALGLSSSAFARIRGPFSCTIAINDTAYWDQFVKRNYSAPPLPRSASNFSTLHPELLQALNDFESHHLDATLLINEVNSKGKPAIESSYDLTRYYQTRIEKLINIASTIEEIAAQENLKSLVQIAANLRRGLEDSLSGEIFNSVSQNQNIWAAADTIQGMKGMVDGASGELRAAISIESITEGNTSLSRSETFKALTAFAFDKLESECTKSIDKIAEYAQRYSSIFSRIRVQNEAIDFSNPRQWRAFFNDETSRGRFFFSLKKWFRAKEIDIVHATRNGKKAWVEVKNKNGKMKKSDLSVNNRGKSILAQLKEDLEIISFLGLEGKVELEFYAVKGIDDDARRVLENLGIRVL